MKRNDSVRNVSNFHYVTGPIIRGIIAQLRKQQVEGYMDSTDITIE